MLGSSPGGPGEVSGGKPRKGGWGRPKTVASGHAHSQARPHLDSSHLSHYHLVVLTGLQSRGLCSRQADLNWHTCSGSACLYAF